MQVISKEPFFKAPGPRMLCWASSFYTGGRGVGKMAYRSIMTRSDIWDSWERSFSSDNGRTWSPWEQLTCNFTTSRGVRRQILRPGLVDVDRDRLIDVIIEGVLPNDTPLDGMQHYFLRYRVSVDGGRSAVVDRQIVQRGNYSPDHPFYGVWVGKNAISDPQRPIRTRAGRILVPVEITPVGPDGEYCNPGGGYTYQDAAVLIGSWTDGVTIDWELSERVVSDPDLTSRGFFEGTIAELLDGRILMILRGSNQRRPDRPGYKWYAVSADGGYHWSRPEPWTYDDGSHFYSPSSMSQLIQHSNGRLYWIGNIVQENPSGNSPRYPLQAGLVDSTQLTLFRDSVEVIDDRGRDDDPTLQLSNFYVDEDRENGDILIHLSRFNVTEWSGDALLYRVAP